MERKGTGSGISFLGLLQIAFICMKVAGVIDLSWWLVFIPTYIFIVGVILVLIIALIIY